MSWKEDLCSPDLTSEAFTEVMAEAIRERLDVDVQVAEALVLHMGLPDAGAAESMAFQCNLRGLWTKGVEGRAPGERQQPCEDYLQALRERVEQQRRGEREAAPAAPDPSDLLPIIQSRAFVRQAGEQ